MAMAMAMAKTLSFVLLGALLTVSTATTSTLTLHNLCPYPIWPLVTPNHGYPPISNNSFRLDGHGHGLASLAFPPYFWAGRVVARTGCDAALASCETGTAPPFGVAQLTVNDRHGLAVYSLSLVDGFNVPMVISPQDIAGGQCPVLGCTEDLNWGCPAGPVYGANGAVVACKGTPEYFKARCPYTRTTGSDVEPVPQSCRSPGELKIVFCQAARVGGGAMAEPEVVIRTVVADN